MTPTKPSRWQLLVAVAISAILALSTLTWVTSVAQEQKHAFPRAPEHSTLNVTSRQISNWDDAVYKGNWLLCIMNAPSGTIYQSPYTHSNDLNANGWTSGRHRPPSQDDIDDMALNDAFEALGIDADYQNWYTVSDTHNTDRPPYKATGGSYTQMISPKDGVIVAMNNYSPDWNAEKKNIPKEQVPLLKQWSDVVALEWLHLLGSVRSAQKINHVIRYDIVNRDTQDTLMLAMGNGDMDSAPEIPDEWPGTQWNIDEDNAMVALTASNSVGVAYLLAQHKEQLGVRVVDQINVFNCKDEEYDQWCLYFHIREGPLESDST